MEFKIFDTYNVEQLELSEDHIESELDYLAAELQAFIARYEGRYRTEVYNIVFIGSRSSRYGAIGGAGATVGKAAGSVNLRDMEIQYDRFAFYITADNKLQLVTADHDGTNFMELILVTEREQQQADDAGADIRVIIDDKAKRSTKLDKNFLAAFGCLR